MGYFGNFGAGSNFGAPAGGGGMGGFGASTTPTLWSLLGPALASAGQGIGGDLHSWLSSLMGGAPNASPAPLAPPPTFTGLGPPSSLIGQNPTYPAGSMQLNPGGTPATATPVGGQPAAPSFYDTGAGQYPTPHGALNQQLIQQGLSAAHAQPDMSAVAATLARAAAWHQMLLGS